jgi:hypothetical protein
LLQKTTNAKGVVERSCASNCIAGTFGGFTTQCCRSPLCNDGTLDTISIVNGHAPTWFTDFYTTRHPFTFSSPFYPSKGSKILINKMKCTFISLLIINLLKFQ